MITNKLKFVKVKCKSLEKHKNSFVHSQNMLQHQDEFVDLFSYFRTLKKNIFIFIFCFQIFLRFRRVWLRGFAFWSFLSSKQSVFPSFFLPFISVFFHKFILLFLSFLFCLLQKTFNFSSNILNDTSAIF